MFLTKFGKSALRHKAFATSTRTIVNAAKLNQTTYDMDHMMPQPKDPKFKTAVVEVYCRGLNAGGTDKLTNGHRYDSVPIANGMIKHGASCQVIQYVHEKHDDFFEVAKQFDGLVVRCNPGHINMDGGSQNKFNESMTKLAESGVQVWPTPNVMTKMGAKDALLKVKDFAIGLPDTLCYYTPQDLNDGFKKSMAFQPRVVKQNRGSSGEGIWIINLKNGDYCKNYGDRMCSDDEMLVLREANDDHVEEHTVGEFIEFCVNGRNDKSGEWKSLGVGKYLEGGKEAGGLMVDQRFLPRIDEGESRFMMVKDELFAVEHYKYLGEGIGGATECVVYPPGATEYVGLQKQMEEQMPPVMKALGLEGEALPLLWTGDFIPVDDHVSTHTLAEFNCSCVGVGGFLQARGKDSWTVVSEQEKVQGEKMCDLMGKKAVESLKEAALKH